MNEQPRIAENAEKRNMKNGVILALDFDGVFNDYSSWEAGKEVMNLKPLPGLEDFLTELGKRNFLIYIFTCRGISDVWKWLRHYKLDHYVSHVGHTKPPAFCYVDDRGLKFEGDYEQTLREIREFRTHWG